MMIQFKQLFFKLYVAVFALVFISCSDDDTVVDTGDITISNSVDFGRVSLGNSKELTVNLNITTTTIDTIEFSIEGNGFTSSQDYLLPDDESITLQFATTSDDSFGDYTGTLEITTGTEVTQVMLSAEAFSGFYIVNEGGFGNGNTSVSFYDRGSDAVINDLFVTANGVALGDQGQSISVHNSYAYVVVQNSSKVEVVDLNDFTSVATIDDKISSPRYFLGVSETKGYVSDWGSDGVSGSIKVIDLTTNTVSATIETQSQGANRMLKIDDEVYVANNGGFGRDNTITVINSLTDEVSRTITVADNPDGMVLDANGNLWVACKGHVAFDPNTFEVIPESSTPASIINVDTKGEVLLQLDYSEVGFGSSASNININAAQDKVYYLYSGQVYELSITDTQLPASTFVTDSYYGLSVDPETNNILGFEAPNFSSSGSVDFYDTSGSLVKTFTVGIGPNGATFN